MTAKLTRNEINCKLQELCDITYAKYESYAYVAGVFQSQLTDVMIDMPKHKQAEILKIIASLGEMNKV